MAATTAHDPAYRIYREPVPTPVVHHLSIVADELVYLVPPLEIEILESPEVAPSTPAPPAVSEQLLAILSADRAGESMRAAFDRKERAVVALFDALTPLVAAALAKRLRNPLADDAASTAFARLVPERRERLLARLDARRH